MSCAPASQFCAKQAPTCNVSISRLPAISATDVQSPRINSRPTVPSHHGKTTPTKCTENPGNGALCICLSMYAANAAWSPISRENLWRKMFAPSVRRRSK